MVSTTGLLVKKCESWELSLLTLKVRGDGASGRDKFPGESLAIGARGLLTPRHKWATERTLSECDFLQCLIQQSQFRLYFRFKDNNGRYCILAGKRSIHESCQTIKHTSSRSRPNGENAPPWLDDLDEIGFPNCWIVIRTVGRPRRDRLLYISCHVTYWVRVFLIERKCRKGAYDSIKRQSRFFDVQVVHKKGESARPWIDWRQFVPNRKFMPRILVSTSHSHLGMPIFYTRSGWSKVPLLTWYASFAGNLFWSELNWSVREYLSSSIIFVADSK